MPTVRRPEACLVTVCVGSFAEHFSHVGTKSIL